MNLFFVWFNHSWILINTIGSKNYFGWIKIIYFWIKQVPETNLIYSNFLFFQIEHISKIWTNFHLKLRKGRKIDDF